MDGRNLLQLPEFRPPPETLTPELVEKVRRQLRMNKASARARGRRAAHGGLRLANAAAAAAAMQRQLKHVHEILRYRALDKRDTAACRAFRLFIKRRLAKDLDADGERGGDDKAERLARPAELYQEEEGYFKEAATRLERD